MPEIISVKNVFKAYKKDLVIKDLNFKVIKGQIVGLLGPNGCGKTTTIRLLNGVIAPEKGNIQVYGLNPLEEGEEIRRLSGILTETAGLYPHLSGRQNLDFFGELYSVGNKDRTDALLEDFGLYEHQDKKVGSYSTGMKKRLGIAKALLHQPQLLFLDEPTNGLDPEGARDLLGYIKRLNEDHGVTILICTHILAQIEMLCDRFFFMEKGTIIEKGTLGEIESRYLKEFLVEVETSLGKADLTDDLTANFVRREKNKMVFKVNRKLDIPDLLKSLLEIGPIYSSKILGRDLETMYFKIREEKNE